MLRSPNLAEAVSLVALFAIPTCFSLSADSVLKETRLRCHMFWCEHSKVAKERKKRDVSKETTWHVHATIGRFCSNFQINLSLCCYVLCAQQQSFVIFMINNNWLTVTLVTDYPNLGWAPKHVANGSTSQQLLHVCEARCKNHDSWLQATSILRKRNEAFVFSMFLILKSPLLLPCCHWSCSF